MYFPVYSIPFIFIERKILSFFSGVNKLQKMDQYFRRSSLTT